MVRYFTSCNDTTISHNRQAGAAAALVGDPPGGVGEDPEARLQNIGAASHRNIRTLRSLVSSDLRIRGGIVRTVR